MHRILSLFFIPLLVSLHIIILALSFSFAQSPFHTPSQSKAISLDTSISRIVTHPLNEYGDLDGDGVFNKYDLCIDKMGTVENDGCPTKVSLTSGPYSDGFFSIYLPYADPDRDGVPNIKDSCKLEPGLVAYHGCIPKDISYQKQLTRESLLNTYTLHFANGSSIIKIEARKRLNHALADLLQQPKTRLIIVPYVQSHHTTDASFAERRAQVIRNYLIQKQIQTNRIQILPIKVIDNLKIPYVNLLIERVQ